MHVFLSHINLPEGGSKLGCDAMYYGWPEASFSLVFQVFVVLTSQEIRWHSHSMQWDGGKDKYAVS